MSGATCAPAKPRSLCLASGQFRPFTQRNPFRRTWRASKPAGRVPNRPGALPISSAAMPELIAYTPIKKGEAYDLRLYQPYTVAETEYNRRDEGFLTLGQYLSGANASSMRCRETQPIVMCYFPDGVKRMRVQITPRDAEAASQTPPQPNDPSVSIEIAGGEVIASLRFEGNATPELAAALRQRLLAALEADGLKLAAAEAEGFFRIAQYGPLNSLSTRVNELWLAVQIG